MPEDYINYAIPRVPLNYTIEKRNEFSSVFEGEGVDIA